MLTSKVFKRLLNGGGEKAGSAGLANEIAALRRERDVLVAELAGFPAQRVAAIEADDFRERKRALAEREEEIYDTLARIDHQIDKLSARALELTGQEREIAWREFRRQHDEAAATFIAAARTTLESMKAVVALREKALASGFERQVASAFPIVPALGPDGCLISSQTLALFAQGLDRGRSASVAVISRPKLAEAPVARVAAVEVGGDEVARGRSANGGADRPAAAQPKPPREARTFGEPGEGRVKARVVRSGYSAPDGSQCARGDFVWLPPDLVTTVLASGAITTEEVGQ